MLCRCIIDILLRQRAYLHYTHPTNRSIIVVADAKELMHHIYTQKMNCLSVSDVIQSSSYMLCVAEEKVRHGWGADEAYAEAVIRGRRTGVQDAVEELDEGRGGRLLRRLHVLADNKAER